MSYLLQLLRRPGSTVRLRHTRVDEYARLNRPGLYGDAFVRVFVSDTTRWRHEPELLLQIADCVNTINLEFSVETAQLRENSLFKADTLITTLARFREALAAEAVLAEQRADN
jgi:hypothetical protein